MSRYSSDLTTRSDFQTRPAGAWRIRRCRRSQLGMRKHLEGRRVRLRPFEEDDLGAWLSGRAHLSQEAQPEGPPDQRRLRKLLLRSGRWSRGRILLQLAIEAEERLVGEIQLYRPPGRPLPPGVYEFGIAVFNEEDRGRGYGAEAISLLTDWLFRDARATRVQSGTPVSNHPMRRLLEQLGFRKSGTVDVRGAPHILYALER